MEVRNWAGGRSLPRGVGSFWEFDCPLFGCSVYADSLYSPAMASLAPTGCLGNASSTIPRFRSWTKVQSSAHWSHNQYLSTRRGWRRMLGEDGAVISPGRAANSVSTRNSLPWRSRRNGLEHFEFAQ